VRTHLASIEAWLSVLTWMVGTHLAFSIALSVPVIWLLLRVAAKVGAV
jgi:hypothetical protein